MIWGHDPISQEPEILLERGIIIEILLAEHKPEGYFK